MTFEDWYKYLSTPAGLVGVFSPIATIIASLPSWIILIKDRLSNKNSNQHVNGNQELILYRPYQVNKIVLKNFYLIISRIISLIALIISLFLFLVFQILHDPNRSYPSFLLNDRNLINSTVILGQTSYPYVGSDNNYEPSVVVEMNGRRLNQGIDYTVSYSNNKSVGTAKVTIQAAKGSDYVGRQTATFEITKSTSPECPFDDVASDDFYYDALLWSLEKGIMTGKSQVLFSPDGTCTRGEFVSLLYVLAGQPEVTVETIQFDDVDITNPYYEAIYWAYNESITKGWFLMNPDLFAPDEAVSRGDGILMIYRMMKFKAGESALISESTYSRTSSLYKENISDYACYEAVLWAVDNSIELEAIKKEFKPDEPLKRSEIVYCLFVLNNICHFVS